MISACSANMYLADLLRDRFVGLKARLHWTASQTVPKRRDSNAVGSSSNLNLVAAARFLTFRPVTQQQFQGAEEYLDRLAALEPFSPQEFRMARHPGL